MDPASVAIGVVSGAAGLVAISIQTVVFLTGISDGWKNVEIAIWDLLTVCRAFHMGWKNTHDWLEKNRDNMDTISPLALAELEAYVGMSMVVFKLLRDDLDRLFPEWTSALSSSFSLRLPKRSVKQSVKVTRHGGIIKAHCDRINRQTTALTLLLSTLQLPSKPLQEVILDAFRPQFRKDEETAWTIVKTYNSTKHAPKASPAPSSLRFGSRTSSLLGPIPDHQQVYAQLHPPQAQLRFDNARFEDDLFTSPVYKRLLVELLKQEPVVDGDSDDPDPARHTSTPDKAQPDNDARSSKSDDGDTGDASTTLRDAESFSNGCLVDLEELRRQSRPIKTMPVRHLPLRSVLRRGNLDLDNQMRLDNQFLEAVKSGNAIDMAHLLDKGADIDFRGADELSEHSMVFRCVETILSGTSLDAIELLLLYHGTQVTASSPIYGTVIHVCMRFGLVFPMKRLSIGPESIRVRDGDGYTPLHLAVRSGERSVPCVAELSRLQALNGTDLKPDLAKDSAGRTALQLATENCEPGMALELIILGCKPAALDSDRLSGRKDIISELEMTIVDAISRPFPSLSALDELLCIAVKAGRLSAVKVLLHRGAHWNVSIINTDRVAKSVGNTEILLEFLQRKSVPVKARIDVTNLIFQHIWSCDKEIILQISKMRKCTPISSCLDTGPAFYVGLAQRAQLKPASLCIHIVMQEVHKILCSAHWDLDAALERRLREQCAEKESWQGLQKTQAVVAQKQSQEEKALDKQARAQEKERRQREQRRDSLIPSRDHSSSDATITWRAASQTGIWPYLSDATAERRQSF